MAVADEKNLEYDFMAYCVIIVIRDNAIETQLLCVIKPFAVTDMKIFMSSEFVKSRCHSLSQILFLPPSFLLSKQPLQTREVVPITFTTCTAPLSMYR